jgi:hypothetical protein
VKLQKYVIFSVLDHGWSDTLLLLGNTQYCQTLSELRHIEALLYCSNCDTLCINANHVSEPPSCEYTSLPGRFLPYTDRYVPQTFDVADCRKLCDQEREFQCRSFNYNNARRDCFLSSDDTFAADKAALLSDRDFFFSERGSCSNGMY